MTPLYFSPKQRTTYYFVSLTKIPLFVKQSGREPITDFEPFEDRHFHRAHSPNYVADVFSLRRVNGFGNRNATVNESLRYSNAGFLAAALDVLEHGGIACSATQGFHHAHYDNGYGYCTFNGLMIAATQVMERCGKVLILDGDGHLGDGTDDITDVLGLERYVVNVTRGRGFASNMEHWNQNMWDNWDVGIDSAAQAGYNILSGRRRCVDRGSLQRRVPITRRVSMQRPGNIQSSAGGENSGGVESRRRLLDAHAAGGGHPSADPTNLGRGVE
jgi:acetoin utilization deacetylase AcuC-like enzyme